MNIPTYEEISIINEKSSCLLNQIDSIIVEEFDFSELEKILLLEENQKLSRWNNDIYFLYLISEIVKDEINDNVDRTLFSGRNVKEAIRVFRILTLYLRRIEFDFPSEEKKEIVNYILQEKISLTAVLGVIKKNTIILEKEKVINGFKETLAGFSKN